MIRGTPRFSGYLQPLTHIKGRWRVTSALLNCLKVFSYIVTLGIAPVLVARNNLKYEEYDWQGRVKQKDGPTHASTFATQTLETSKKSEPSSTVVTEELRTGEAVRSSSTMRVDNSEYDPLKDLPYTVDQQGVIHSKAGFVHYVRKENGQYHFTFYRQDPYKAVGKVSFAEASFTRAPDFAKLTKGEQALSDLHFMVKIKYGESAYQDLENGNLYRSDKKENSKIKVQITLKNSKVVEGRMISIGYGRDTTQCYEKPYRMMLRDDQNREHTIGVCDIESAELL